MELKGKLVPQEWTAYQALMVLLVRKESQVLVEDPAYRGDPGLQDSQGFKERPVQWMFSIPQVSCLYATASHLQFPFVVREKSNYGMAILYFTLKETKRLIIKIWVMLDPA